MKVRLRPGPRSLVWVAAAVAGVLAGSLMPWPEFRVLGGLFVGLVLGLIGEFLIVIREGRRATGFAPLLDLRPADGAVEIEPIADVAGVANPRDPRFQRITSLGAGGISCRLRRPPRPGRRLLGKVVVQSIFVGRDGERWSDAEIAKAMAAVLRAGEWIERQAIDRGAAVNLAVAGAYLDTADARPREAVAIEFVTEGRDTVPDEAEPDRHALSSVSHAVADLGLGSFVEVCRALEARVAADAVAWLVHVRAAGRSRALDETICGVPGINLAVCHAREDDFPGPLGGPPFPDPITFVHELLHLFGATDKYGVPLGDFPRGSVTERDIMRLDIESLARLRIDPLTAREIGWSVADRPRPPSPAR